jgi:hypothetical protein
MHVLKLVLADSILNQASMSSMLSETEISFGSDTATVSDLQAECGHSGSREPSRFGGYGVLQVRRDESEA